jgi:hypothetical protein
MWEPKAFPVMVMTWPEPDVIVGAGIMGSPAQLSRSVLAPALLAIKAADPQVVAGGVGSGDGTVTATSGDGAATSDAATTSVTLLVFEALDGVIGALVHAKSTGTSRTALSAVTLTVLGR